MGGVGVDLDVLIGHELTAEQAFELPERLSCALPVFAAMTTLCTVLEARGWRAVAPAPWFWHQRGHQKVHPVTAGRIRELWADRDTAILDGPVGWFNVGSKLIRWGALDKIAAFAQDDCGLQAPTRALSRAVALELGGSRAIYLPDSGAHNPFVDLVNEDVSLDEAVARLATHQPRASDLASLYPVRQDARWLGARHWRLRILHR